MSNMKRTVSFILVLAVILVTGMGFCGCETYDNFRKAFIDPPVEEAVVIKIGVFEPTTGRASFDAEDEILGFELAHFMYPKLGEYDIELVYQDNRSSAEEAVTAARALAEMGVVGVLGSYSSTLSMAGSDIFKEERIPAITATEAVPILTLTNEYYFRTDYAESYHDEAAADFISTLSSGGGAVLLSSDTAVGVLDKFFERYLKDIGISINEVSGTDYFDIYTIPDDPDEYDMLLAKICLAKGSDAAIYCPESYSKALPLILRADNAQSYELQYLELPGNTGEGEGGTLSTGILVPTEGAVSYGFNWLGGTDWKAVPANDKVFYLSDTDNSAGDTTETDEAFAKACEKYFEGNVPELSLAVKQGFDAYLLLYTALCNIQFVEYPDQDEINAAIGKDASGNQIPVPDDYYEHLESVYDKDGKVRGDVIAKTLIGIKGLQGLTKIYDLNENGDPIKTVYVYNKYNVILDDETGESELTVDMVFADQVNK